MSDCFLKKCPDMSANMNPFVSDQTSDVVTKL